MLRELTVENLAVIEFARLELGPEFTALTGETGAGKSLLIDSVQLALGGRADSDLVRHGAAKAVVTLVATVTPEVAAFCLAQGVDIVDGSLVVHREVSAEGRSTVRLNGRTFSVGVLRDLGNLLVDMHGQHDHQALLSPDAQLEFLDRWAGSEMAGLRERVASAFAEWSAARSDLSRASTGRRDREQRIDMLEFQIGEIEAADLQVGESDKLADTISRLRNAERLRLTISGLLERVYDGESATLDATTTGARDLESLVAVDGSLRDLADEMKSACESLREVGRGLREYLASLDADAAALDHAVERADLVTRLKRKYGDTEEAVLAYMTEAQAELSILTSSELDLGALESRVAETRAALETAASSLTRARIQAAERFSHEVQAEIRELAMEKAQFQARLGQAEISALGADSVEFLFSANSGEPARPLAKVASGGELSRVMLAVKVASAGRAGVPTMVFDEVDTGLSGKTAAVVGRKIAQLALSRQVVVISHLPQVAATASAHFLIVKEDAAGRVSTRVNRLDGDDRVNEIARMLAGEQIGESALLNARELIATYRSG
jgi:DNA repair protein RecN (Recombination protein N)